MRKGLLKSLILQNACTFSKVNKRVIHFRKCIKKIKAFLSFQMVIYVHDQEK